MPTFWASQIGLLANNVLPVRAGELVRMLALHRETGLRRTAVLATVGVERVFDLAALALSCSSRCASHLPDCAPSRSGSRCSRWPSSRSPRVVVAVLAIAPVRHARGTAACCACPFCARSGDG